MTLRAPLFTRRFSRKVQAPQVVPNLLITVLAAPFFFSELTYPQTPVAQEFFQQGSPLALIEEAGEKPFSQNEWPNPQVPVYEAPGQIPASPVLSVSVEPPFFQTDWPIPSEARIQAPVLPVFPEVLVTGEKPFNQNDWPNPVLTVRIQTPFQVGIPANILETAGEKASAQPSFPNPPLLPVVQPPYQHPAPLTITETAGEKPFHQDDWITPPAIFIQEPYQYAAPIHLFPLECNVDVYGCMVPVETDILTAMVENTDVLTAIVENTDVRSSISTDATDVLKEIVETEDVDGEIC